MKATAGEASECRQDKVQIDERKVRGYLLSRSHRVGRFKARVFAALGFDESTSAAFIAELRRVALAGEVTEAEEMEFGRKYTVPGELKGLGSAQALTVLDSADRAGRG